MTAIIRVSSTSRDHHFARTLADPVLVQSEGVRSTAIQFVDMMKPPITALECGGRWNRCACTRDPGE
jgi:hypothetical protein